MLFSENVNPLKRSPPWEENESRSRQKLTPALPLLGERNQLESADIRNVDQIYKVPKTVTNSDFASACAKNSGEHVICYGALHGARAAYLGRFGLDRPSFDQAVKSTAMFTRYALIYEEGNFAVHSSNGKGFALLDNDNASVLEAAQSLGSLRFQAIIQPDFANKPQETVPKSKKTVVEVAISIYGPSEIGKELGALLTLKGQFLQHPDVVDSAIKYENPQYFRTIELAELNHLVQPRKFGGLLKDSLLPEVDKIMNSLDFVDSDWEIPITDSILTPLLSHQEAALKFIRQKENPPVDVSSRIQGESHGRSISRYANFDGRRQTRGGILADVMGLGKTLTFLSAIVLSRDEAHEYPFLQKRSLIHDTHRMYSTSATLVVVPSAQLIEVWKSEIARRIAENTLQVAVFHGVDRINDPQAYTKSDVVLTTYSTLVKDSQNSRVLHRLDWFRVVLDEAHWIRNQETEQFRSVNSLQAHRRWCLTGTPIQNRLEDLGALVRFLKVEPFEGKSSKAQFKSYIADPLFSNSEDPCQNLRDLLRSILLRRTSQDQSNLTATYESIPLSLSYQEKWHYDRILEKARTDMDLLVSSNSNGQKYTKIFAMILRLRMFCDLGQFSKGAGSSQSQYLTSQSKSPAESDLGSELGCDLCQQEESLDLIRDQTFCPSCSRLLRFANSETSGSVSASSRVRDSASPRSFEAREAPRVTIQPPTEPQQSHQLGFVANEVYPTKLLAVTENLRDNINHSKSIVFSCWTRTLDVLARILTEQQLPFVRIDGNVSYPERNKRLSAFQESPQIPVLLMTFGTGAVGLNLTEANHIHIVEPQWNPTVEAQAIGRALRLGQKREVKVFRYVMENTVEQNILDFQKRKEKLSKFAFEGGLDESLSEKLQELRFILNLS